MRLLYTALVYLLAPIFCAVLLWRGLRDRHYWKNFRERFGYGETLDRAAIWVHAVSVGEVQAAGVLVQQLHARYPEIPLVVTTLTPTGERRARSLLGEQARIRYLPLDLPGSVRRFFTRVKPRLAVIFETELWPNLYHECGRRRVPLVLASARISPRSVGRYRRFLTLFRQVLSNDVVVAAQGEDDAERFRSIGANPDRTHVTGNIKFDFAVPRDVVEKGRALREAFARSRPVWIAGSTHAGEEQEVLDAHRVVQRTQPDALLIIVPRHPNRFDEVAEWLERANVRFVRRSQSSSADERTEVLLVDTLGELLNFYAASDVAFVGGSLVSIGGHNLLEPAALGLPILTGPHTFNSKDIAQLLLTRGAASVVNQADELGGRVSALLADADERARIGALARASVEDNRGALAKLLGLIEPLLQQ